MRNLSKALFCGDFSSSAPVRTGAGSLFSPSSTSALHRRYRRIWTVLGGLASLWATMPSSSSSRMHRPGQQDGQQGCIELLLCTSTWPASRMASIEQDGQHRAGRLHIDLAGSNRMQQDASSEQQQLCIALASRDAELQDGQQHCIEQDGQQQQQLSSSASSRMYRMASSRMAS